MDDVQSIIIDCGSYCTKAGFSGEWSPRSVFRTVISTSYGDPHFGSTINTYIGDDAYKKPPLSLRCPIDHDIVTNWNDMEQIIHYIYDNQLRITPENHPVVFSELATNTKANREKLLQIMLETFKVPSYYVGNQNVFAVYGTKRTTGLSCDIGDSVTSIVPVYEGYSIQGAFKTIDLGGSDITNRLQQLLNENGKNFVSKDEKEIVYDIKENCGRVAPDGDKKIVDYDIFKLPNGELKMSDENYRCTEILFGFSGIDKNIVDSIKKTDIDIRVRLYSCIILSGGSSMFEGLPERLENEVTKVAPVTMKIKIVAPPERKNLVWIGGSEFASLPIFPECVITQDEYKDVGSNIVHRKCLS